MLCKGEGCDREARARGYCMTHYWHFVRKPKDNGSVLTQSADGTIFRNTRKPKCQITEDMRMEIIKAYVLLENAPTVAEKFNVNTQSVRNIIRLNQPLIKRLRENRDDMLQSDLTKILHLGVEEIKKKMGAASAKDVGIILGIVFEKRQLLRGGPTAAVTIDDEKELSRRVSKRLNSMMFPEGTSSAIPGQTKGTGMIGEPN